MERKEMDTIIESYLHEGLRVNIYLDEDAESPQISPTGRTATSM